MNIDNEGDRMERSSSVVTDNNEQIKAPTVTTSNDRGKHILAGDSNDNEGDRMERSSSDVTYNNEEIKPSTVTTEGNDREKHIVADDIKSSHQIENESQGEDGFVSVTCESCVKNPLEGEIISPPICTPVLTSSGQDHGAAVKVDGILPSVLEAYFHSAVTSPSRFYLAQNTKDYYGFYSEVIGQRKYPKIVHINQPYNGWIREILVEDDGNFSVNFIPPLAPAEARTTVGSGSIIAESPVDINALSTPDEVSEFIQQEAILKRYPTIQEARFEFADLFCLCHREDEGDYFNCEYGLAGCGSWFHSDCVGISKGALSKLVPEKDTAVLCPLCTAYLEANLDEDSVFSVDQNSGVDRTIFRLRMGGYYYVTTGPLVKYTASNDDSARLYICMIPRSEVKSVPYYRNVGGVEFIQSQKPPKYWGMSRLRSPVATTTKNIRCGVESSGDSRKGSSLTQHIKNSKWIANCNNCHAIGPYSKTPVGYDGRRDGKNVGREIYELHLVAREGETAFSKFCGVFNVNPRVKPTEKPVASRSVNPAVSGRIIKKISRKATLPPGLVSHSASSHQPRFNLPPISSISSSQSGSYSSSHALESRSETMPQRTSEGLIGGCEMYPQSSMSAPVSLNYANQYHFQNLPDTFRSESNRWNANRGGTSDSQPLLSSQYAFNQGNTFGSNGWHTTSNTSMQCQHTTHISLTAPAGSSSHTNTPAIWSSAQRIPHSSSRSNLHRDGFPALPLLSSTGSISKPDNEMAMYFQYLNSTHMNNSTQNLSARRTSAMFSENMYSNCSSLAGQSEMPFGCHDVNSSQTIPLNSSVDFNSSWVPGYGGSHANLGEQGTSEIIHPQNSQSSQSANVIGEDRSEKSYLFETDNEPKKDVECEHDLSSASLFMGENTKNQVIKPTGVDDVAANVTHTDGDNCQNISTKTACKDVTVIVEEKRHEVVEFTVCDDANVDAITEIGTKEKVTINPDTDVVLVDPEANVQNLGGSSGEEQASNNMTVNIDMDCPDGSVSGCTAEHSETDQTRFLKSIENSINMQNDAGEQYESDDSHNEEQENDMAQHTFSCDANFLKRKRKALSISKPYESLLKKRLLERENSRLSSSFQNSEKYKDDVIGPDQNYLFLSLPLEDGGVRSCGFNTNSRVSHSIQSYIARNNLCSYCIEPITPSDSVTTLNLGVMECNFHKPCSYFLSVNATSKFIESRGCTNYISAGKLYNYRTNDDTTACRICVKNGGVLQVFSLLAAANPIVRRAVDCGEIRKSRSCPIIP